MIKDLVSIIVPIYNRQRYISDCIESILMQSYCCWELILIDDGSTDQSGTICERYSKNDRRIKYFHFSNEGPSVSRNRGIKYALGNYIMFIDSDDMLFPSAISELMELMDGIGVDIVQGQTVRNKHFKLIHSKQKKIKILNKNQALESLLYQSGWTASCCGKLYKRNLFRNIQFKKGSYYEDLDMSYKILNEVDIVAQTNSTVYFYRNTPESIINTWNLKRLDVLEVTSDISQNIEKKYPGLINAAFDRQLSANFNMFFLSNINKEKENAQQCWKKIKELRKKSLFNNKVRLKNKTGILLSYFGKDIFYLICRLFYIVK